MQFMSFSCRSNIESFISIRENKRRHYWCVWSLKLPPFSSEVSENLRYLHYYMNLSSRFEGNLVHRYSCAAKAPTIKWDHRHISYVFPEWWRIITYIVCIQRRSEPDIRAELTKKREHKNTNKCLYANTCICLHLFVCLCIMFGPTVIIS